MGHDSRRHQSAMQEYERAHAAHYRAQDLPKALRLYEDILATHPESVEAGYCRSQIQNIARAVVPAPESLASQAALARKHLAGAE